MNSNTTIRNLYKAAYRNARCVRNLNDMAELTRLDRDFADCTREQRIHAISFAVEHLEERRYSPNGWENSSRRNLFIAKKVVRYSKSAV